MVNYTNTFIEIKLDASYSNDDILLLHNMIKEENMGGVISKIYRESPKEGTMSSGDYMPVIQLVLGSTVIAATINNIFKLLKSYIKLRAKSKKRNITKNEITINFEKSNGEKYSVTITNFDESNQQKFEKLVGKVLKS